MKLFQEIPYKDFFPNSPKSLCMNKNGKDRLIKIVRSIEQSSKSVQSKIDDDDEEAGESYEGLFSLV